MQRVFFIVRLRKPNNRIVETLKKWNGFRESVLISSENHSVLNGSDAKGVSLVSKICLVLLFIIFMVNNVVVISVERLSLSIFAIWVMGIPASDFSLTRNAFAKSSGGSPLGRPPNLPLALAVPSTRLKFSYTGSAINFFRMSKVFSETVSLCSIPFQLKVY